MISTVASVVYRYVLKRNRQTTHPDQTVDSMKPKIMFVISNLKQGGAQTQMVYVASALAQRGWRVTILQFQSDMQDGFRVQLESQPINVITLNAPDRLVLVNSLLKAFQIVRHQQPDALIGFSYHGIMTARLVGRAAGVPVIVSSIRNERRGWREGVLVRLTDRLCDATTTMSDFLAAILRAQGIVATSRLHVIPNMVPITPFTLPPDDRLRTRRSLKIGPEQYLWLAAGGLRSQKGYPNLLQAFALLASRLPTARLVIAGAGKLRDELDDLICQLELTDVVRFLGLRSDMPTLYRASDGFVLASSSEGMPNVLLEAMMSRKPVVATSVGSVGEMISDGQSGLIVPPGNHIALADALTRMMTLDETARQKLTELGFERACSEYSPGGVTDKWENLLWSLLKCS